VAALKNSGLHRFGSRFQCYSRGLRYRELLAKVIRNGGAAEGVPGLDSGVCLAVVLKLGLVPDGSAKKEATELQAG